MKVENVTTSPNVEVTCNEDTVIENASISTTKDPVTASRDNHTNYPSRFALGDRVFLEFNPAVRIHNCEIVGVLFKEPKVFYDVAVDVYSELSEEGSIPYTIVREIDSCFVHPEFFGEVQGSGI